MFERNLGNLDRIVRLIAGTLFAAWAISQPALNGVEWFVMAISLALIMNGVFQRCYLWYVLDINTHNNDLSGPRDPSCQL
jgi:hypothetical protein